MDNKHVSIIIGALLHDIGKVLYRDNDRRNHSESGYDFLKERIKIEDKGMLKNILEQVRYHHKAYLEKAKIDRSSPAYITYMADNIAAATDRRDNESDEFGFDINMSLESIFNILNQNKKKAIYEKVSFEEIKDSINFPIEKDKLNKAGSDRDIYYRIKTHISEILKSINYDKYYINSLLSALEADLSFIPSSTSKKELADISLYDHVKVTAAIASCIYLYFNEENITDYKAELFDTKSQIFYKKNIMLLFSMDISGIQSFIYDIQSEDALKNLRSRSFYLDTLLESIIDNLLERLELSRANLLYSGGGHAYLLIQNTAQAKEILNKFEKDTNKWFLDNFKTALYIAMAYTECNAYDLQNKESGNTSEENKESGSYKGLYSRISSKLSMRKMNRYSAEAIRSLNNSDNSDKERECAICRRSDKLIRDGKGRDICRICYSFINISRDVMEKQFLKVISGEAADKNSRALKNTVPLPYGEYLVIEEIPKNESIQAVIRPDKGYIKSYIKNDFYIGYSLNTKLWIGDYKSHNTLEELVKAGEGIDRLGVLRADVDNLGSAVSSGFDKAYNSISRNTALSRNLSIFFKFYINNILKNPVFSLDGDTKPRKRNAAIIYSGGDDLFIVGAWKDILEFSIDLYESFKKFSLDSLTLSAGYGVYESKYPISYIAEDAGRLESLSKKKEGKNSITLFSPPVFKKSTANNQERIINEQHTYKWEEFKSEVIKEKFNTLKDFFSKYKEKGAGFLYRLLELFRDNDKKINIARLAYLLGRIEAEFNANNNEDYKGEYREFAEKIYKWRFNENDRQQFITAIYIYAYLIRQKGE